MEIYEIIKHWVEVTLAQPVIDKLGRGNGDLGLFPQGVQVLRVWEDVLGGRKRRVRYGFILRLHTPPGEQAAKLLFRLQEAAAVTPPQLGQRQQFEAVGGKLLKSGSDGLGIYEIRLNAEREEIL